MTYPKTLKNIIISLISFPMVFLVFGIYHGLMQVLYRAGFIKAAEVIGINYYQGLTAHGVINAILLTSFFNVAFGHVLIYQTLGKIQLTLVKLSTFLMFLGAISVLYTIFSGQANVLYTFYPPLKAHPAFYIGLAIFVIGTWVGYWAWINPVRDWHKKKPGVKIPMAAFGMLVTFILWQICTIPVAVEVIVFLIPWSLGWTDHLNIVLSRTLFWFFGHPLVYFWLLPIYVMYYNVLPKITESKLYSDFAGRIALLVLMVISTPLGFHHQFTEPGISANWKAIHMVLTSIVAIPSLMTAFTVAASLEYGARLRGGRGLFGWWKKLPYFSEKSWLFSYFITGLIIFIFGGATGIVNASYSMNLVIHNTSWLPAHFHLTVAGPVFLGILGMSLYILVEINNKKLYSAKLAMLVPYLWMIGVMMMSTGQFIGSFKGEPRRTNLGLNYLNSTSPDFRSDWVQSTAIAAIGGSIMTLAIVFYFYVLIRSLLSPAKSASVIFEIPLSASYHNENIAIVNTLKPWIITGIILALLAYGPPIYEILKQGNPGGLKFSPDNPSPQTGATH